MVIFCYSFFTKEKAEFLVSEKDLYLVFRVVNASVRAI